MLEEFVNYVDSFYGQDDPLYPMMSRETKQPLTKFDIQRAAENYLVMCLDEANKFCTWGDGDSLDRERVRDILLEEVTAATGWLIESIDYDIQLKEDF